MHPSRRLLLPSLLLAFTVPAFAQPALRPAVTPAEDASFGIAHRLSFNTLDLALLEADDTRRDAAGEPYRFAVERSVFLSPNDTNAWAKSGERDVRWRVRVTANGAESLNFGFSRFRLPAGGRLLIYAADGSTALRPFTAEDNQAHGELWTPVLLAADAVLEVVVPEAEKGELELTLTSVNQGYRGFGERSGPDKSGACNVDVACSQGDPYRDIIRSVARITISGRFLCSGAMINNTRQDFVPYFLTAEHCDITTGNVASVVSYWGFENTTCRTPGSPESGEDGNGSLSRTLGGATLVSEWAGSDFTLLRFTSAPPSSFRVHWAGWDRSGGAPSSVVGIHHPRGDEKRISFENNPLSVTSYLSAGSPGDGTHLRVADWDQGTTEGGSSGSPIFNASRRIVGQLHGGFAACGNDDDDWYGRLARSWTGNGSAQTRLSDWLDPTGSGVTSLGGGQPATGGSAPAAPTALTVAVQSSTVVRLDWRDNANNESEYRIEVALGNGVFQDIGSQPANSTAVLVTSLVPGNTYRFRVRARAGNLNSGFSNIVSATMPSNSPPAAPTDLRTSANTGGSVTLAWTDRSSNETGFEIEAQLVGTLNANGSLQFAGGAFTLLQQLGANTTQLVFNDPAPNRIYNFRVRARNAAGTSAYTNVVASTTRPAGAAPVCGSLPNALCLLGQDVTVQAFFQTQAGQQGTATPEDQSDITGFFWFFSPSNLELVVKVLDASALTGTYWAFSGALTDVRYWIVLTDTATGTRRTYYNPQGNICGVGDTQALPAASSSVAPAEDEAGAETNLFFLGYLDGDDTRSANKASCVSNPTTLCLADGRFQVRVNWTNQHQGNTTGQGGAIPSLTSEETGYFWFFNPDSIELVVKVIDGRAINGKFWVFWGGLSDVQYSLTVTDTNDNEPRTYNNAPGNICGGADTAALDD
jgi:lysyl endopeptidase